MKRNTSILAFLLISISFFVNANTLKYNLTDISKLPLLITQKKYNHLQKQVYAPFQGKKVFCSTAHDEKAFVSIKGNQVNIIIGKRKITGIYKKKKILLTNDSDEIEYRKNAQDKYHYGTYYVIEKDFFSILLAENGEYDYYVLCK